MSTTILTLGIVMLAAPQEAQQQEEYERVPLEQWATELDPEHREDVLADIEKGREFSAMVPKELEISEDMVLISRLRRVGHRLAEIANTTPVPVKWGDPRLSPFPYEFYVVEDDEVNAFSLPGGIIYVNEGLIEFAETDDELAGVLAHEIAHAAFRHVATLGDKQSDLQKWTLPLLIGAIMAGGDDERLAALIAAHGAGQAFFSGWSVEAETAADAGALRYLQQTDYNPVGLLTFMERLAYTHRLEPKIDWGIFQTHPPSDERAEAILELMRSEEIPIRRSEVSESLATHVLRGEDGMLEIEFGGYTLHTIGGDDAIRRADSVVATLDLFFDSRPGRWEVGSSGSAVTGAGRILFEIRPEDLRAGETLESATARAVSQVKQGASFITERLWGSQR